MLPSSEGWCVWITGLPGSGKSVISEALLKLLAKRKVNAQRLSSDSLRKVLTPKPTYSLAERDIVYAALVYVAETLVRNRVNVVIDATGNLKRYRENARNRIPKFIEVYLKCPLTVCMQREAGRKETYQAPTQIYSRALKGKASSVPGVGQPYERPVKPDLMIDTTKCEIDQCAQRILDLIYSKFA